MKSVLNVAVIALLLSLSGCTGECNCAAEFAADDAQRATEVKALAMKAWTDKDKGALMEVITDDFVRTINGETVATGKEEMDAAMDVFFTAFPNMVLELTATHVADKTIVNEWVATGTHNGVFGDIEPTGASVKFNGSSTVTYADDGKISREDVYMDELGLMEQLGYVVSLPVAEVEAEE